MFINLHFVQDGNISLTEFLHYIKEKGSLIPTRKRIALVAHDKNKGMIVDWCKKWEIVCTSVQCSLQVEGRAVCAGSDGYGHNSQEDICRNRPPGKKIEPTNVVQQFFVTGRVSTEWAFRRRSANWGEDIRAGDG